MTAVETFSFRFMQTALFHQRIALQLSLPALPFFVKDAALPGEAESLRCVDWFCRDCVI